MTTTVAFIHSTGLGPFMWSPYRTAAGSLPSLAPFNLGYEPGREVQAPQRAALADDVAHLATQLPQDAPLHLVAHSWGATIALALARSRPQQVASLWLYEPVLFGALLNERASLDDPTRRDLDAVVAGFEDVTDATGGGEDWLRRFTDYWNGEGAWAAMSDKARQAMRRVGWKMYQEVRSTFEDADDFDRFRVQVPVTLVVGARSQRPARAMSQQLAARLPSARLHHVPSLAHMSVLDRADALAPLLADHLRSQGL